MKRLLSILILTALTATIYAQGVTVWTKKFSLADFTGKTTKIVLSENFFFDSHYKKAIQDTWYLSDYEFCTLKQYNELKDSADFYFVVPVVTKYKGETEPGLRVLDVVKGGFNEKGKRINVCTFPVSQADNMTDENITYLPVLVEIIQKYVESAIKSDVFSYGNLEAFGNLAKVPEGTRIILDSEQAMEAFNEKTPGAAVGYVLRPAHPVAGASYCYKIIFSADCPHTLYYFKRVKVGKESTLHFTAKELKKYVIE